MRERESARERGSEIERERDGILTKTPLVYTFIFNILCIRIQIDTVYILLRHALVYKRILLRRVLVYKCILLRPVLVY